MDRRHELDPFQSAIVESRDTFVAAIRRGDAAAASEAYAEHAKLVPPSAELMDGRQAIAAFWEAGVDAGIRELTLDPVRVERDDVLAFEIGRYTMHLRPADGDEVSDRGRYLLVHLRQPDGHWRRAVEVLTPDPRVD